MKNPLRLPLYLFTVVYETDEGFLRTARSTLLCVSLQMTSAGSVFEQWLTNGSLSPVAIGAVTLVVLAITYAVASRFLFSSSSKSKSGSSSKTKDGSGKKANPTESAAGKKKPANNKGKKNATAAAPAPSVKAPVSSASPSSQSEESEEESEVIAPPPKKVRSKAVLHRNEDVEFSVGRRTSRKEARAC